MHITLPKKMRKIMLMLKMKLLPKTLFFRTMLLIFVPLIVVQVVSIVAFFDGSWGRVGKRLSSNLTSNIAFVIDVAEKDSGDIKNLKEMAKEFYELDFEVFANDERYETIKSTKKSSQMITGFLEDSLERTFPNDMTTVYMNEQEDTLIVFVETKKDLYRFVTSSKNIFSSSIFGFVAWMVGTSFLLFLVAVLFLRIQVRSIADLAETAEAFGKGIDKPFKPYGSSEVRKAGMAFTRMKERIQRQITERTRMLAGVSHDLRTPLTRMRLQLAMIPDDAKKDLLDKDEFLQDVSEMEKMLDGYLSFAKGENGEEAEFVDVNEMILSILNKFRNSQALIRYTTNEQISAIEGRELALKRAFTNIIGNAINYGKTIAVAMECNNSRLEITVDDDGPGIPKDKRDDVFKAFYRLEDSRNKETGGVGLGLSIARDVITSHGGKIELEDAPIGGLRVLISIPL